ncbi:MAG: OmpA family protein [Candidatus Kapabacteria bacterium]|nr:OmpA family protein [Candidatus Kapabacteria bacterium]
MEYRFIPLLILMVLAACSGSQHLTEYELQRQFMEDDYDSTVSRNYITSTLPIDSADVNKIIYDLWRLETDQYPENIKIYARVYDSLGHFITNMADPYKKDKDYNYFAKIDEGLGKIYNKRTVNIPKFTVREYGANDSIPYNIMLCVDNSGSMSGVFNTIMDGAELFTSMKFKYDKLAVATFSDDFELRAPLSDNTNAIISLLRAKRKQGLGRFSSVNEALWKSIDIFEGTSDSVPRVMAIFTDGDENYSKKEVEDIIQKARDKNVHVFCVAFGYSKDDGLKKIAKYTGGKFYKAYTKEELTAIFRDIYMSLRFYYFIQYLPPKYYGTHFVYSQLSLPGRADSLIAEGEYDVSNFWGGEGNQFVVPITFDFNKSDIKPESFEILDGIADQMLSNPKIKIEIQGHTDNIGTVEINQVLSEKRANSVKEALVSRGIEAQRIRTRGFGMTMPVANNDTEEGRAKNRRTQFVILAK